MTKEIEIPEGYEARIDGNKVIIEPKESEDEKIREKLVEYISDWKEGQMRWNSNKEFCSRALAYLEKQKEQKSAEWSEEEIRTIVDDYAEGRDTYTSCINRLKSLRPQPHWKPNEEQMKALDDCVRKARGIHNASMGGYDAYPKLQSLLQDLKKL